MKITFDPTIKLSDVITSLSFVLAILALVYSQSKDRQTADHDRLAEARAVLTKGLTKIERWTTLTEFVFDEMQPTIVQTSEIWNEKDGDVVAPRDYLWRELNRIYAVAAAKILDEGISTAYIDLYRVSQTLPVSYQKTVNDLETLSRDTRERVLADTEEAVLSFNGRRGQRVTAEMGNKLRAAVKRDRTAFQQSIDKLTEPIVQRISEDVAKSDSELLANLHHK